MRGELSEEDKQAWNIFSRHSKDFDFDSGSFESRCKEAERFTKVYYEGTPYCVVIEEYCAFCTEACV